MQCLSLAHSFTLEKFMCFEFLHPKDPPRFCKRLEGGLRILLSATFPAFFRSNQMSDVKNERVSTLSYRMLYCRENNGHDL